MRSQLAFLLVVTCALCGSAATNAAVSRVPPAGLTIPESTRVELAAAAAQLGRNVAALKKYLAAKPLLAELISDVEVFHKAVEWPLRYDEFYRSNELAIARDLIKQGTERARQLREGKTPWLTQTGLVVRGYVSKIDGSVQPYGLVVPTTFAANRSVPKRLDIWLHGRDNLLTELKFIHDRQRSFGEFAPSNAFVLHPYGRYCNAFKFAGETDVFEAMEHARKFYPIDPQRIALRGFSMGGAGVWHLGAHYPDVWAAAAPGAGFAETAEYTGILAKATVSDWERTLWGLYDATDYALNFSMLPVVAYNGTDDKQRQAADVMERAMRGQGLDLPRVWGTNVGHKYTPQAKVEINSFVDSVVGRGKEPWPDVVTFATRTLRFSRAPGLQLLALERHWVPATLKVDRRAHRATTTNVHAFLLELRDEQTFSVDDQRLSLPPSSAAGSKPRQCAFRRDAGGAWKVLSSTNEVFESLHKRPGLQGPIDDAFMDSFLFVRPTGKSADEDTQTWLARSLARATNEWRAQFRGDAPVKDDVQVTESDIAAHNLVLWGDPRSNRLLGRIINKLPIKWNSEVIQVGKRTASPKGHLVALIFPNPLNPSRYVVLNSGFTFAKAGAGSNAQQTPKLPDYAVLDVANDEVPVFAGFFNEEWQP